jgi:hypothetical protein
MQLTASSLNDVIVAAKHNEVSNIVDAQLFKDARFVRGYGFIADVQYVGYMLIAISLTQILHHLQFTIRDEGQFLLVAERAMAITRVRKASIALGDGHAGR